MVKNICLHVPYADRIVFNNQYSYFVLELSLMKNDILNKTVENLMASPKGLIAMDESNSTCCKRFKEHSVDCTEENRRRYRQMIVTTPGLEDYISGAILYDETIRQSLDSGELIRDYLTSKGIVPGIKVDEGTAPFKEGSQEKITNGLDGLDKRFEEYASMGARFSKWRAVINIGKEVPTEECIKENSLRMRDYVLLAQDVGIVPIVEPEVLIEGDHDIDKCFDVTSKTLNILFNDLSVNDVYLPGVILKSSMVISGNKARNRAGIEEVAEMTIKSLKNNVPRDLGGVVFLSGGQEDEEAAAHLNAMNNKKNNLPWRLTFSYSRAIQRPALKIWSEDIVSNIKKAQESLLFRAKMCSLASEGKYSEKDEESRPY